MIKFSFIIGYRNRDYQRVKNSLDSLARQKEQNFEVVFVNYGSDEQITSEIEHLVKNYSFCKYIYSETRGMVWSRAHALNTGLRLSEGEYVIFSDIDLLFPANFTEFLTPFFSDRTFLTQRCYYLPEGFELNSECNGKFDDIPSSYVGLLAAKRENALKINGFDEFYQVWGAEDDDFITRLERAGLQRRIIDVSDIPIWHQWHPTDETIFHSDWYIAMLNYFFRNNDIKRNTNNWGQICQLAERPVLKLFLSDNFRNHKQLELWNTSKLRFLPFYNSFFELKSGDLAWFEFLNTAKPVFGRLTKCVDYINILLNIIKYVHYRLVRVEALKKTRFTSFEDVYQKTIWFIGENRDFIKDYYIEINTEKILFIMKKK